MLFYFLFRHKNGNTYKIHQHGYKYWKYWSRDL